MTTPIVPSITDEQLAKLERLSDGANQSGWYWDDKTVDEDGYTFIPEGSCLVGEIFLAEQYEGDQEDCNFIEAAKPAVIKSLITRLRAAEKDAERYRWLRDHGLHHEAPGSTAAIAPGFGPFICMQLPSSGAPNRIRLGSGADAYIDAEMERSK